ncbi:hypothetical protein NW754_014787 [Fusarium falciforme]|nr:hypothetical protein NW754_014787 [Fusarium falciforme]
MPRPGRFARTVPRRRAFGTAIRGFRRARRRALVAAVVATSGQILSVRETDPDIDIGGAEYNDEEVLDEYLREHERGFRLGLRRGQELGYRRGASIGFAQGLRQAQEEAYNAGFRDGLDDAHEYQ